jgi:hypothetical protein
MNARFKKVFCIYIFLIFSISSVSAAERVFVTWNLEWLDDKDVREDIRNGCLNYKLANPDQRGVGECDKPRRSAKDFAKLAEYAAALNADVIGVQEVYNVAALQKIFPPNLYEYWLSGYKQDQKTGVVVRKASFVIERGEDFTELGVQGGRVRYGADVIIRDREDKKQIRVLSVHLKSGCFQDDLGTSPRRDCKILQEQLPILEKWIDSRQPSEYFIVMGDFNRRLLWEARTKSQNYKDGQNIWFWPELSDGGANDVLMNGNVGDERPRICARKQYDEYIDHILFSRNRAPRIVRFSTVDYNAGDFEKYVLSDHCPVIVKALYQ